MHPIFIVAVPLILILFGMVLNSIGLSFDQPPSSPEQDPTKKLAIERETFRQFFDRQRSQAVKRQHRVGQYAWLLLIRYDRLVCLGIPRYRQQDGAFKPDRHPANHRIARRQGTGSFADSDRWQ